MSKTKISFLQGDLTKMKVDAIVNAANSSLMGGGGVDGAIHRAGGPAILAECRDIVARQGKLPAGEAVITTAGKMPAKHVIHTVGPVWNGGHKGEPAKLANCYRNSLKLADAHGLKSIAFPNISTGVYGYPKDAAAEIAVKTVKAYIQAGTGLDEIKFVIFDDENVELYRKLLS